MLKNRNRSLSLCALLGITGAMPKNCEPAIRDRDSRSPELVKYLKNKAEEKRRRRNENRSNNRSNG